MDDPPRVASVAEDRAGLDELAVDEDRARWLSEAIRDVADFPRPGVVFKDLTPLFADPDRFKVLVDALADALARRGPVDTVIGIEARGFIVGAAVAYRLGAGFTPVRKSGKLPSAVVGVTYALEYGDDRLELHADAVGRGHRVLVVDDVLATGGTAAATIDLVEGLGGEVVGAGFALELPFLHGRDRLDGRPVITVLRAG